MVNDMLTDSTNSIQGTSHHLIQPKFAVERACMFLAYKIIGFISSVLQKINLFTLRDLI